MDLEEQDRSQRLEALKRRKIPPPKAARRLKRPILAGKANRLSQLEMPAGTRRDAELTRSFRTWMGIVPRPTGFHPTSPYVTSPLRGEVAQRKLRG